MRPCGTFRDHAAEIRVQLGLTKYFGGHYLGGLARCLTDYCGGSVIAAAFKAEYSEHLGQDVVRCCVRVKAQVTLSHGPYNAAFKLMHVLLTRPLEQSQTFSKCLDTRFKVTISPVIKLVFLDVQADFSDIDALVFTSQNGVTAYKQLGGPSGIRAYCVGAKTAACAHDFGLDAVSADGDINALNQLLEKQAAQARLLHLCGRHTSGEVQGNVTRLTAYDQVEIGLNDEARALLARQVEVALPIFSARSAIALQKQLDPSKSANLTAICLSDAVASVLDAANFGMLEICDEPSAGAMRDKMSEIFPA